MVSKKSMNTKMEDGKKRQDQRKNNGTRSSSSQRK
jgi:hypothetical protein